MVQFSEPEPLAAEVVPSPPVVLALAFQIEDDGVTAPNEEAALNNEKEDELSAEAEARSTSTTTTTTLAPSTTVAQAAPAAPSGSSGSGSSPPTTAPPKATPTTQPPPPPPPSGSFNSGMESDFYSRINSLRASNGLPALSANGSLASYARNWAKYMADQGSLGHSNIGSLVPPWSSAGENVGTGGSVGGIFGALAGSSAHLSNMLGNFTHVGVGVYVDAGGTIWTAHVFAR